MERLESRDEGGWIEDDEEAQTLAKGGRLASVERSVGVRLLLRRRVS